MSESLKKLLDLSKQLQAFVAGGLPYPAKFLPLNPQIVEDLWVPAAILAFIASAINYNMAQHRQRRAKRWAERICYIGFFAAIVFLILMLMLVENYFSSYPSEQYLAAEIAFFGFFVGVGFAAGWGFGRVLN